MKLIVGLGNPGRKYENTRHNVGFRVLALLATRYGQGRAQAKFNGEYVAARVDSEAVSLLCPHTYMNRSGASVSAAVNFFKVETEDLLVVCDDFNLPLAKLRFRARGSAGGQRGLEDVIQHLGGQDFARLRIGVGSPPENWDAADFVLSKFTREEAGEIGTAIEQAATAAADWVGQGIEYVMNQYNA